MQKPWSELLQVEFDVYLTLLLLFCQTLRRLLECQYLTRHSERKMHVTHYLLGLFFYTAVGPTAMLNLSHIREFCEGLCMGGAVVWWAVCAGSIYGGIYPQLS